MFEKDLKRLECANLKSEFVARIYDGDNIVEACAMMRLNPAAVGMTRRQDVTFDADIRAAQGFRVEVMVDKLENISAYESDSFMASVVSKNIQWLATKRMREIYGDKMDVNHNVKIDIRAAIMDARARVISNDSPMLLDNNINATDSTSAAPVEVDPLS
jgi:hypothetical protein